MVDMHGAWLHRAVGAWQSESLEGDSMRILRPGRFVAAERINPRGGTLRTARSKLAMCARAALPEARSKLSEACPICSGWVGRAIGTTPHCSDPGCPGASAPKPPPPDPERLDTDARNRVVPPAAAERAGPAAVSHLGQATKSKTTNAAVPARLGSQPTRAKPKAAVPEAAPTAHAAPLRATPRSTPRCSRDANALNDTRPPWSS